MTRGSFAALAGFAFPAFFAAFSSAAFSFAAFFWAAFSSAAFLFAAFLSVTSSLAFGFSLPLSFLELDPRRNTITLLNLSLLERAIDAADCFVGRRLDD